MAVTSRGREETCVTHPDRPASSRCAACHKPVCSQCEVSTAEGKFCSHQCADRTADFRTRCRKEQPRGAGIGGVVRLVIWLIAIGVALCVVNRYLYKVPAIGDHLWNPPARTP
jgi:hypothetical protein